MKLPFRKIDIPRIGQRVHVAGWNAVCVFVYEGMQDGQHILRTPKTGKVYKTTNSLTCVRKDEGRMWVLCR